MEPVYTLGEEQRGGAVTEMVTTSFLWSPLKPFTGKKLVVVFIKPSDQQTPTFCFIHWKSDELLTWSDTMFKIRQLAEAWRKLSHFLS